MAGTSFPIVLYDSIVVLIQRIVLNFSFFFLSYKKRRMKCIRDIKKATLNDTMSSYYINVGYYVSIHGSDKEHEFSYRMQNQYFLNAIERVTFTLSKLTHFIFPIPLFYKCAVYTYFYLPNILSNNKNATWKIIISFFRWCQVV